MSSGNMKGHLCLKSGPYAATSSKYTTQLLVKSNLDAHHRMVNNAKSTIDNKVPKGWQNSQKVRDQLKRDMIKNGRPPPSRSTSRSSQHSEERYKEELFDDDPAVGEIVRNHLPRRGRLSPPQQNSTNHVDAMLTLRSADGSPIPQSPRYTNTGDVLKDRKHVFTQPDRPFTPRTLKSTRKSKLSEFKYYNAPPSKKTSKPKSDVKTGTTSENLTFEPLRSRDFRQHNDSIPRLDITVDKDHMKWLEEQATKANIRTSARLDPKTNTSRHRTTNPTLEHEDDELKYLDFISAVTNDVLDRQIYTNKALQSVFDSHIEKNMDKLSVKRMNEHLEKLRLDLGLSDKAPHQQSSDVDVESRVSSQSRGSGLERYKRNLERTLRDADLDSSVAHQRPGSPGLAVKPSMSSEVEEVMNEIHNEEQQHHPPPQMPEHLMNDLSQDQTDHLDDVLSDISAVRSVKSQRSNASVPKSEVSRTSGKSGASVPKSVKTQASVAKSEKSRASVAKSEKSPASVAGSEKSQGQESVGNTSLASKKNEASERRSARSNASTLKDNDEKYSVKSSKRGEASAGERTPVSFNHIPDSEHSELENGNPRPEIEQSDLNSLAKDLDQLDLESEADTTVDGASTLNSTMKSDDIGEENKWMKNPSNFTMTLKPGQLDMTVVKPRARARRRISEERKSTLQDISPRSEKSERRSDKVSDAEIAPENKMNGNRPVAKPRGSSRPSSAKPSEAESANYSDGRDDF